MVISQSLNVTPKEALPSPRPKSQGLLIPVIPDKGLWSSAIAEKKFIQFNPSVSRYWSEISPKFIPLSTGKSVAKLIFKPIRYPSWLDSYVLVYQCEGCVWILATDSGLLKKLLTNFKQTIH